MTSAIDTSKPVTGSPTTQSVRDNFLAARNEIIQLQGAIGWADYNDTLTATTPISPTINTFTKLTNNGLGPNTNTSQLPTGVTSLWNPITNQIDLSQMAINSMVNARYDISITTTAANQEVFLSVFLAIGSPSAYESPKDYKQFKTAGTYPITIWSGLYIGSSDVKDFPAEIRIKSSSACTVRVNGWYFQAFNHIPH
jgi:hypothetical protein